MFIETHLDSDIKVTFIKSTNVFAYPCGRRRSKLIDKDNNENTVSDQFYFPFDPEARLNTEANNRKHSSLNGYTQTYLKDWDPAFSDLTLALEGYLFKIKLDTDFTSEKYKTASNTNTEAAQAAVDAFGAAITSAVEDTSANYIYANILLEDVHLFSGFQEYYTSILRNQSAELEQSLDLLNSAAVSEGSFGATQNFENYYFSGLSFSTTPLSGKNITRSSTPREVGPSSNITKQLIVSLCILEKDGSIWKIHEPARLPLVEHGSTENSIVLRDTEADSIITPKVTITNEVNVNAKGDITVSSKDGTYTGSVTADVLYQKRGNKSMQVPTIELVEDTTEPDFWQLQFSRIDIVSKQN